jgi:methylenetetrahydrofolate dehydrogenase (NADP+)/methenyltetrahydrofolate cyclohydrolase
MGGGPRLPHGMQLIQGAKVAATVLEECQREIAELAKQGKKPGLAVVLVGDDPASRAYVRSKDKKCKDLGLHSVKHELPGDTTQEELLALVAQLNADPTIHGILVQSPPPKHIDESAIVRAIDPRKDVDVLGRSMIVGKPVALLLMAKNSTGGNATVTVAHSRTKNLADLTRTADILIAAIGRPLFVKADMVKEGAVVIDVGINRVEAPGTEKGYKIVGDVDFDAVAPKCRAITPVPGGVGPMTIALLMANTIKACRQLG